MRENPKPFEVYRHFKGNKYQILTLATDSEDGRACVVYQAMYGDRGIWVRPKAMFDEIIEREGKTFRRFSPISAEDAK